MRPVCVFAKGPGSEIEQLRAGLRGRWRQAARAVMVQLSLQGLSAAQIAVLLECHPATVRRWIGRFNDEGWPGWRTGRDAGGPGRAVDPALDPAVPRPTAGQHAPRVGSQPRKGQRQRSMRLPVRHQAWRRGHEKRIDRLRAGAAFLTGLAWLSENRTILDTIISGP